MSNEPQSFAFLLLCRDLLLSSKVTATAKAIRVAVKQVRSVEALATSPAIAPRLIADFNEPGFLQAAADWKRRTGGWVVGFAGHADANAFAEANALGIDRALARGAFVANLETILQAE